MTEKVSPAGHQQFLPAMGRDRLLRLYDPFTRLLGVRPAHRLLVAEAGIEPGHDVLEVGCGTGNLALLAGRRHPDARVVGLDPDPMALDLARRKAARRALPLQLDRGFATALPYPDASFDRVLSAFMLHHLEPAEKLPMLREVRRVLRPGGRLHLLDFGGTHHRPAGLLARRTHASPLIQDQMGDRIPALLRDAGFTDPVETGQQSIRAGQCAVFRAQR